MFEFNFDYVCSKLDDVIPILSLKVKVKWVELRQSS